MLTTTKNHSTPKNASRENTPTPRKNALWKFFADSTYSTTIFADETHCSCLYAYEPAPGVHYYGYRYYSSQLGRWITRDPIGEVGSYAWRIYLRKRIEKLITKKINMLLQRISRNNEFETKQAIDLNLLIKLINDKQSLIHGNPAIIVKYTGSNTYIFTGNLPKLDFLGLSEDADSCRIHAGEAIMNGVMLIGIGIVVAIEAPEACASVAAIYVFGVPGGALIFGGYKLLPEDEACCCQKIDSKYDVYPDPLPQYPPGSKRGNEPPIIITGPYTPLQIGY